MWRQTEEVQTYPAKWAPAQAFAPPHAHLKQITLQHPLECLVMVLTLTENCGENQLMQFHSKVQTILVS